MELIEMNKFWRFFFRYDITFKKWTASEKVHRYMNLFGHVIKFCEDRGLSRRFDHIQIHFLVNFSTELYITYIYIWKGKLFRIVQIREILCFQ